jgi:hypothetical protein
MRFLRRLMEPRLCFVEKLWTQVCQMRLHCLPLALCRGVIPRHGRCFRAASRVAAAAGACALLSAGPVPAQVPGQAPAVSGGMLSFCYALDAGEAKTTAGGWACEATVRQLPLNEGIADVRMSSIPAQRGNCIGTRSALKGLI